MISITIGGTVIEVPNTTENPNWGPAMVTFFKAVEGAFASALGPYDIPPQVVNIDGSSYNPASTPVDINGLSFSTTTVRSAFIEYSVYREADYSGPARISGVECGHIVVVYDTLNGTWSFSQDKIGDASITFYVTSAGQIQFTTTAVGTTNHVGKISFKATALTNS